METAFVLANADLPKKLLEHATTQEERKVLLLAKVEI
jgi:hypothetical protein